MYPCSRREVIEAFGRDLLSYVGFKQRYEFYEARQGRKRPFRGAVLASVYVSPAFRPLNEPRSASLYVYSVKEAEFSVHIGHQLVRVMKATMAPLTQAKLNEIDTSPYRTFELVANLSDSGLELFELRSLPKNLEVEQIEI